MTCPSHPATKWLTLLSHVPSGIRHGPETTPEGPGVHLVSSYLHPQAGAREMVTVSKVLHGGPFAPTSVSWVQDLNLLALPTLSKGGAYSGAPQSWHLTP